MRLEQPREFLMRLAARDAKILGQGVTMLRRKLARPGKRCR